MKHIKVHVTLSADGLIVGSRKFEGSRNFIAYLLSLCGIEVGDGEEIKSEYVVPLSLGEEVVN